MEENKSSRKKVFEIIDKFSKGKQTIKDFKQLMNIVYHKNLYNNSIVYPLSKKELKVQIVDLNKSRDADDETVSLGSTNGVGGVIKIDPIHQEKLRDSDFINILKLFETLGHEFRHIIQGKASLKMYSYNSSIPERLKDILESFQGILKQDDLTQLFQLEIPQSRDMDYLLYRQLPYEEDARDCGWQFAKQMFEHLTQDELCDEKLKAYLNACKNELDEKWLNDLRARNTEEYQTAKNIYKTKVQEIVNNDEKTLFKANIVRANMRRNQVDKKTYFEYMLSHNVYPNKYDNAYLEGENLKMMLLDAIKENKISPMEIVHNSFGLNFKPNEVADFCLDTMENGNKKVISDMLFYLTHIREDKSYLKSLKSKGFDKKVIEKLNNSIEEVQTLQNDDEKFEDFVDLANILKVVDREKYGAFFKNMPSNLQDRVIDKLFTKKQIDEQEQ